MCPNTWCFAEKCWYEEKNWENYENLINVRRHIVSIYEPSYYYYGFMYREYLMLRAAMSSIKLAVCTWALFAHKEQSTTTYFAGRQLVISNFQAGVLPETDT